MSSTVRDLPLSLQERILGLLPFKNRHHPDVQALSSLPHSGMHPRASTIAAKPVELMRCRRWAASAVCRAWRDLLASPGPLWESATLLAGADASLQQVLLEERPFFSLLAWVEHNQRLRQLHCNMDLRCSLGVQVQLRIVVVCGLLARQSMMLCCTLTMQV